MPSRARKEPEIIPPSVTPEFGIELLRKLVADGDKLLNNRPISTIDKDLWENKAKDYFLRVFGSESKHINVVLNAGRRGFSVNQSDAYYEKLRFDCLTDQVHAANSMIELLELEIGLNTDCPKCGKRYPKGLHNFCLQCGNPLNELYKGDTLLAGVKNGPASIASATSELIRVDGSYWDTDSFGTKTGDPYCSRCWEVDARRIHLVNWEGIQHCPQCASPS